MSAPLRKVAPTLAVQLAWRNLWRNPRRTLLSASAIAFTIFLVMLTLALNVGTFGQMIEFITAQLHGHLQLQHPAYRDDPLLEHRIADSSLLAERLRAEPLVRVVGRRAIGHFVASGDESSDVAQVLAVEPEREAELSTLSETLVTGRYLRPGDRAHAVLGGRLAAQLGVGVGDEVVLLGTTETGGMAALAAEVVGILAIAQRELDRTLMVVPLRWFQEEVELADSAHQIVVRLADLDQASLLAQRLNESLDEEEAVARGWRELIPDIVGAMEYKMSSQFIVAIVLAIMVTISIANTFLMMVYERTRELGMLRAVGMRTGLLMGVLQLEALLLWAVGAVLGVFVAVVVIGILSRVGISMPADELTDLMQQFAAPERMYPALSTLGVVFPLVLLLVTTQLAALVPVARLRKLDPAAAMRLE